MNINFNLNEYLNNLVHEDFKLSQNSLEYSQSFNCRKKRQRKSKKVADQCNPEKKKLTSTERKLNHHLPQKYISFDEALGLHRDWLTYFKDMVDVKRLFTNTSSAPNEYIQSNIQKMCFIGAQVKITQSANQSLIGIKGIIIMDFLNTFRIVDKNNLIKIIPKKNSLFEFQAGKITFSIYGAHLCIRQIDRMVKKTKTLKILDYPKIHSNTPMSDP